MGEGHLAPLSKIDKDFFVTFLTREYYQCIRVGNATAVGLSSIKISF